MRVDIDAFTGAQNMKKKIYLSEKWINLIQLLSQYKLLKGRNPTGVVVVGVVCSIKWINHVIIYPSLVDRNIIVNRIYSKLLCSLTFIKYSYLILECWAQTFFIFQQKIQS